MRQSDNTIVGLRIASEDVERYRAEQATLHELANTYRVSVATVWRQLKRQGICRGSRRGRPKTTEKHPAVVALALQGLPRSAIAERMGISPEWVRCILAEHGMSASLRALGCAHCGAVVAEGHKTYQAAGMAKALCPECLKRVPKAPLAQRLKTLRLARNLSVHQLSAKCSVSRAAIGNYERGSARPSWKTTCRLARGLGVAVAKLTGSAVPPLVLRRPKRGVAI